MEFSMREIECSTVVYPTGAPAYCHRSRLSPGFTLIELMVTLAVFAIILSVGTPSLRSFLSRSELASNSNHFLSTINHLRTEAIRRNSYTTLCPSTDGLGCNGTDWKNGWIAFEDTDRNSLVADDSSEEVFSVGEALKDDLTFHASTELVSYIQYKADGTLSNTPGQISICHVGAPSKNNTRIFSISAGGRVNSSYSMKSQCL